MKIKVMLFVLFMLLISLIACSGRYSAYEGPPIEPIGISENNQQAFVECLLVQYRWFFRNVDPQDIGKIARSRLGAVYAQTICERAIE